MYATLPHLTNFLSFSLCISYRDKHVLLFVYQYMNFLIDYYYYCIADLRLVMGSWGLDRTTFYVLLFVLKNAA